MLLWKGFPRGFRGGPEGFQGFRECDPRQEMVENVGRCAESWIRGRRRRPGEQTPNIILYKEFKMRAAISIRLMSPSAHGATRRRGF